MSTRWALVGPDTLEWVAWETDHAVFHGVTGETHLLSELPALVLRSLHDATLTEEALCVVTAERCGAVLDDAWRRKIQEILWQLDRLELVEQAFPRSR